MHTVEGPGGDALPKRNQVTMQKPLDFFLKIVYNNIMY